MTRTYTICTRWDKQSEWGNEFPTIDEAVDYLRSLMMHEEFNHINVEMGDQ